MDSWCLTLLSLSLSGALLIAGTALLAHLLRNHISRAARYYLWIPVLVRLLCPFGLPDSVMQRTVAAAQPLWTVTITEHAPTEAALPKAAQAAEVRPGVSLPSAACVLWAAGAAYVLASRGAGYFVLCRSIRRTARPADQAVREARLSLTKKDGLAPLAAQCSAVQVPMLVGLLRPKIVLPERDFTQDEWQSILAHELIHWRRHDIAVKWIALLAAAVHWFNPAVWWFLRRIDLDCELACDEAVTQGWDAQHRVRYGELLLALAAGRTPSAALFSQKDCLKERLCAIMTSKKEKRNSMLLTLAAALTVVLTAAVMGAYLAPTVSAQNMKEPVSGQSVAEVQEAAQGDLGEQTERQETAPLALSWPVQVTDGTVALSSLHGEYVHPITGKVTVHNGIDIPLKAGTPILAAADGTVEEIGFTADDGNYVVLRHGTCSTRYHHLQETQVETGAVVAAGAQIGTAGSTGTSTGSCLHLELTVNGQQADPLDYLPTDGTYSMHLTNG